MLLAELQHTMLIVISCSWLMRWSTEQPKSLLQQLLLLQLVLSSIVLLSYQYSVLCWPILSGLKTLA